MTDALISVMIVDDEPLYIEEINRIYPMAEHGFELVCTAINGKDALTKFRKYHPQIVITDIEMPILNGIELCKAIRRESQDTKLLFLTVYNELDYIRSALRLSAFDYILKFELSPETLDEKMNAMRRQILSERETELELLQNSVYSLFSDPDTSSAHALLLEKRLPGLYLYLVAEINRPLPFLSPAPAPADADRFRLMVLSAGIGDYVFSLDRAHLLVLLNPGRSAGEHAFHALVSHRATQLKELLSSCGEQFTFYTCSSPMDVLTFARYYRKNLRTFERKYFQKGNVFPLSPLPSVPEPDKVDVSRSSARLAKRIPMPPKQPPAPSPISCARPGASSCF